MNTEGKLLHKQEEVAATLKFLFCQNDAKSPGTNRVIFFSSYLSVKPGMVTQGCKLSSQEVEEGEAEVQGYPWLESELKVSQSYMRPV